MPEPHKSDTKSKSPLITKHERTLYPIYTVLDNVNADVSWIIVHTDHRHDYEENLNTVYAMILQREKLTYLDCKN